jgi:hypothetical protein
LGRRTVAFEDRHRAKLEDLELASVEPASSLAEDRRSRTVELDQIRDRRKERRQRDKKRGRDDHVERPLHASFDAGQRRALEHDRKVRIEIAFAATRDQASYCGVWIKANRQRRIAQLLNDVRQPRPVAP